MLCPYIFSDHQYNCWAPGLLLHLTRCSPSFRACRGRSVVRLRQETVSMLLLCACITLPGLLGRANALVALGEQDTEVASAEGQFIVAWERADVELVCCSHVPGAAAEVTNLRARPVLNSTSFCSLLGGSVHGAAAGNGRGG